ncbi:hypothetical protein K470DRAFT_239807 [Piedraia hortae CBS 480.64]|uniref:MHYT domain-containing protein n=1 Tax=Piedraia hortae CBS 480.64 TaxID=1314780 RepID=A0A6A7C8T7_9PEZI|nr:hypothetical protein K470DRAFT_239807 [Piedraia hortae CBS 480.64]
MSTMDISQLTNDGDIIIQGHFEVSLVAAAYLGSLSGCLLTIELLHRRGTGLGNWRSWLVLETVSCATCMALVGIWCMHFIGNRAIVLGDGDPRKQLVYSPGYTTLSIFLPIIGLTLAFSAAELSARTTFLHWAALTCTGIFAGLSIVGMHYVGNFGISNYSLHYAHRLIVASVIIAIGDCMLVLLLFYTLREKWISSWWKRLLCAAFLAGGVSAMHFSASTGCRYERKKLNSDDEIRTRNTQVAVAGALCAAAFAILLIILVVSRHRARLRKTSSRKVMLACAMFDEAGRILVTTDGVLPAKEITDKYQHRTFSEDFDTAHPVFQWIYRVSHNWAGVSELIPRMKNHMGNMNSHMDSTLDYSVIFRERFCIAAASLAGGMHMTIERMGVLYDRIVETGTLKAEDKNNRHTQGDLEAAKQSDLFGKGQLLFLTRQLNSEDVSDLINAGYRFGHVQQVGRNISQPLQIPLPALEAHITGLKSYVNMNSSLEKSGTWLSFFALIPRTSGKGFDVAVKREERNQLPDVLLTPSEPQPWQVDFLHRMDGMRTSSCMAFLQDRNAVDAPRSSSERTFSNELLRATEALRQQVPPEWFREARFVAQPVYAHYPQRSRVNNNTSLTCIYSFCVIADLHISAEAYRDLARTPLTFFSARQRCYPGSPDHSTLAREIHQEFGPLLTRRLPSTDLGVRNPNNMWRSALDRKSGKSRISTPNSRNSSIAQISDSSSVHELVEKPGRGRTPAAGGDSHWGGILVDSETVVESDSKQGWNQAESPGLNLGLKTAITTARQDDTFVDELLHVTKTRFLPQRIGY